MSRPSRSTRPQQTSPAEVPIRVVVLRDSPRERLVLLRLAPGTALPLHRTPSTARFVVLEGEGEFVARGVRRRVAAGAQVAFPPHLAHGVLAGETPLSVVMLLTPGPAR